MQKTILVFAISFLFMSCLKKIDEVDELNTNIFDREYSGEQYWDIKDHYKFTNILGQNKVRFEVNIPNSNLPDLRPSNIKMSITGSGLDTYIADWPIDIYGGFSGIIDVPYVGIEATYCITIGLYLEEEEEIVNPFEECVGLL